MGCRTGLSEGPGGSGGRHARISPGMTASNGWLKVESLDLDGQGVARNAEGKVVFVEGALPGEEVQVQVHRRKNNWEQATMTGLRRASTQRVAPRCRHFGVC